MTVPCVRMADMIWSLSLWLMLVVVEVEVAIGGGTTGTTGTITELEVDVAATGGTTTRLEVEVELVMVDSCFGPTSPKLKRILKAVKTMTTQSNNATTHRPMLRRICRDWFGCKSVKVTVPAGKPAVLLA